MIQSTLISQQVFPDHQINLGNTANPNIKLAYKVSSRHKPIEELTAHRNPHLHFIIFKNSTLVQKQTLVKLLG